MKSWTFSSNNSRGAGWFQFFGIYDWWEETFTEDEKLHILETYKPLGGSSEDLIKGDFSTFKRSSSGIHLLTSIVGYFDNKQDRHLAYKILQKAEDLVTPQTSVIDQHFLYMVKLQTFYKDREKGEQYLNTAIRACLEQIFLAPRARNAFLEEWGPPLPGHKGFTQLAIIYERSKKYKEAIELCQEAQEQGWNGDWEKRIERVQKKQNKLRKTSDSL